MPQIHVFSKLLGIAQYDRRIGPTAVPPYAKPVKRFFESLQ